MISGANRASRTSISSISSRMGATTTPSYSARCASNHGLRLLRARPRRKRSVAVVKGTTSVRLARMVPKFRRRLDDAADVGPDGFALAPARQYEVGVVRLHALQVVDHQVPPAGFDARPQTLPSAH